MLKKTGKLNTIPWLIFLGVIFLFFPSMVYSQNISLTSELGNSRIWLGDSIRFTILLQGSEEAFEPKLLIPGVRIENLGGSGKSSESIMTINGKVTRNITLSYIYSFRLTPEKVGTVTIPPIELEIEGKTYRTNELSFEVALPELSEDYHLLISPDIKTGYISEEIELNLSFLFNSSIRELDISIPELEKFTYKQAETLSGNEQYRISINGKPFTFYRSDQSYNGTEYAGIATKLLIKSNAPGEKDFSGSIAVFDAVTGSERVRDFFGGVQEQAVYSKIAVPAEPVKLKIKPFPEKNKPLSFTGLSGDISAEVSAEPREVHIGDPITLKIRLKGLNNPESKLPSLKSLLGDNFDIPDTRSYDDIKEDTREITQTIRVRSTETKEIPALVFSYFDTNSGKYKEIATTPIPLKIEETTIVTSQDLEGGKSEESISSDKNLIGKTRNGFFYNYTGNKVLERKAPLFSSLINSPAIRFLILSPPVIYLIFILITSLLPKLRHRIINNRDRKAAYRSLVRKIKFIREKDPKEFLRLSNREIDNFIKKYSIDCSNSNLSLKLKHLKNCLYGNNSELPENSREMIDDLLKLFKEVKLV